jgi:hypothetical protein
VNIGAFTGSKYCSGAALRKYRVEIHNMRPTVTSVSSAGAALTAVSAAEYHAGSPGYCFDAGKGGVLYINATGNAAAGFQVLINGGSGAASAKQAMYAGALERNVLIKRNAHSISIRVPFQVKHVVEVFSLQGKLIARRNGAAAATYEIPSAGKAKMIYMIRVSAGGQTLSRKMIF